MTVLECARTNYPLPTRWQAHPKTKIMMDTFIHIRTTKPKFVILENVQGLADKLPDEQCSALDVVLKELQSMNMVACAFNVSTASWIDMERARTHLQRQQC